jgi:GNAT superfamily N-acetyltransferase
MEGTMMVPEFQIAQQDDIREIYDFHKRYFGEIRSEQIWQWEYGNQNPGDSLLLVARNEQELIATQGMMEIPLLVDGKSYPSGKNESLLIEKDFRRTGLFTRFYQYAFAKYAESGICCLWGFTKRIGQFQHIGFSFDRIMSRSVLTLDFRQAVQLGKVGKKSIPMSLLYRMMIALACLYSRLSILIHRLIPNFYRPAVHDEFKNPEDLGKLLTEISSRYPRTICIDQNEIFVQWRIQEAPVKIQGIYVYNGDDLQGYLIYELHKQFMEIDDLLFSDVRTGRVLMDELLCYLRKNKIGLVSYSGNRLNALNKNAFRLLRSYGFIRQKGPNGFVLKIFDEDHSGILQNLKNWYITGIWFEGV